MNELRMSLREARLNITFEGLNGDFVEPVPFNLSDAELKALARNAIVTGGVPGIAVSRRRRDTVDLSTFVVDRFPASGPHRENRVFVRPLTPFG